MAQMFPRGLPEMTELLAQRARIESVARLVRAVECRDHRELAERFLARPLRLALRLGQREQRARQCPLTPSSQSFAWLKIS